MFICYHWSILILSISSHLIIPDRIHTKALLRNVDPRHSSQLLITPAIHLYKSKLIIAQGYPLITEITRADRVGVATAGRSGVDEELTLNLTRGTQLERGDVASHIEMVGSSRREQVLATLGCESHVATILIPGWQAWGNR